MKKIVVVSDSHGNSRVFDRIFSEVEFDHLIFLGDGINDLGIYENDERVKIVRGNCDFFSPEKYESFLSVENVLIFFTHGHEYSVKSTLTRLYNRIEGLPVNIVCYGHTHRFSEDKINNITFHNPGSISCVRGGAGTYSVITVDGKNFSIQKCSF